MALPRMAVACGVAVVTLTACGATASETARDPSPVRPDTSDASRSAVSSDDPRLWIQDGDRTVAFDNGHRVTSNGLDIEIYVSPYPPARSANIDFYVTRGGVAVDGANVTLQYDMTVMDHGPFALTAHPTGAGHYLAPLEFFMTGDFLVNVAVGVGDSESIVNLFVRAVR